MCRSRLQSVLSLLLLLLLVAACSEGKDNNTPPPSPTPDAGMEQDTNNPDDPNNSNPNNSSPNNPAPDMENAEEDTGDSHDTDLDDPDLPEEDSTEEDLNNPDDLEDMPNEDASEEPDVADMPDEPPCDFAQMQAADRDRVVLLSHPFTEEIGVDGTEISAHILDTDGNLTSTLKRLDVGFRVFDLRFLPAGDLALALGEDGELATINVGSTGDLTLLDTVELPSASYGDMNLSPDATRVYITGTNSAATGGISTVRISCQPDTRGALSVQEDAFFPLRLAFSSALSPEGDRAYVFGGQAVFDPVDDDDLRILDLVNGSWEEVAALDLYNDFIGVRKIAISPEGDQLILPNNSEFSAEAAQIMVVSIEGDSATETRRFMDLPNVQEARYSPDGSMILLTQDIPNRLRALVRNGDELALLDSAEVVALADHLDIVERGPLSGTVILPSTHPADGPQVVMVEARNGQLSLLNRFSLGTGSTMIPLAIAIAP